MFSYFPVLSLQLSVPTCFWPEWSSSTLYKYSKTILRTQPSKQTEGRGDPYLLPPRSPDLFLCDFIFESYVKDQVYYELCTKITDVKKIHHAVEGITEESLRKVSNDIENKLSFLIPQNQRHSEILLQYCKCFYYLIFAFKVNKCELFVTEIWTFQIENLSTPCI